MVEHVVNTSEGLGVVPGFRSRIVEKMQSNVSLVTGISRPVPRSSLENSSGMPYEIRIGNFDEVSDNLYHLLDFENPDGRSYLLVTVNGRRSSLSRITNIPLVGFIYRPAPNSKEVGQEMPDKYHLLFLNGNEEMVVDIETPHDHYLATMHMRPTLQQLLLTVNDLNILNQIIKGEKVEYHGAKFQKQSITSRAALINLFNNQSFNAKKIEPQDFGFSVAL